MKKLLPVVLLLIGAGAGVGAGIFMRPTPAPMASDDPDVSNEEKQKIDEAAETSDREYVKMNNQFVVPVVSGDAVTALVVMSLSLEVPAGQKDAIYSMEPKLRDSFLQVLFDHANVGGFNGAFTNANNMAVLRGALREVAQKDMGDQISDVLILEIARQDY
ncbi:flagellar basal body-associated FliL family protein [Tateyamaria sp. ANG-S1]|uniref:flagellar basal body-associated FliL family protein n=1 Tax=Tateyamaria sp. ANG-S1 TaxID=1577905 RepID=UPI00057C7156|nr:flagellar basal body-associated FliL family protein [Tateyamaria sp. ANG-S1]KIC49633.1 flagellar basal body-associated protein FliL [Tateyamaria sp. ANG-S1]